MPIVKMDNDEQKSVDRYYWPAQFVTPTSTLADDLVKWRKEYIKLQETSDKKERKYYLKLQRACTFMLPWFRCECDKDQIYVKPILWPTDLSPELDELSYRIIIEHG